MLIFRENSVTHLGSAAGPAGIIHLGEILSSAQSISHFALCAPAGFIARPITNRDGGSYIKITVFNNALSLARRNDGARYTRAPGDGRSVYTKCAHVLTADKWAAPIELTFRWRIHRRETCDSRVRTNEYILDAYIRCPRRPTIPRGR